MVTDADEFPGPLVGGRFRLGKVLGAGGQAQTYLALDTQTHKRVAVKAFDLGKVKEWKELDLFRRECRTLKELEHPGIPRHLAEFASEDGKTNYLVMERVAGDSLKETLDLKGPLSEAELWRILWQMSDILTYLHGRSPPVVHRDIKPANIIQGTNGDIALVDFGVVHTSEAKGETFVGTFGYMAPEQLHGEATPATDIYALGATLIALGTGKEPEQLPHDGLRLRFEDSLRVSPALKDVLGRMIDPEPHQRYPSALALKEQLEHSATASSPLLPRTSDESLPALGHEVPPPVGVAVGVLLTMLGVLGTVLFTVVDVVVFPLILAVLGVVSPDKSRKLTERRDEIRGVLKQATTTFRTLSSKGMNQVQHSARQLEEAAPPRMDRQTRRALREDDRRRQRALQAKHAQRQSHR